MLILHHPEVASRDCRVCQQYLHEESGALCVRPGTNHLIRRPPGVSTPCRTPKGCPKGTPDAQLSLTPQNEKVYDHYVQCKAVGRFPDDPLVERHAGIIRQLEDAAERMRHEQLARAVAAALGAI
jgi:hypothetical protein